MCLALVPFLMAGQGPSAASLTGTVAAIKTGEPLGQVQVSLIDSEGTSVVTRPSDARGHFEFESVPPGRYRVVPTKSGFVFARESRFKSPREVGIWITVERLSLKQDLSLFLEREASIQGQVLDSRGKPLFGQSVALLRYSYDDHGNRSLASIPYVSSTPYKAFVSTNDRGEYRFFGLQHGEYYVAVAGSPLQGIGQTYFPGTLEAHRAAPVTVEEGEERRLNPIVLQQQMPTGQVVLRFPEDGDDLRFLMRTIRFGPEDILLTSAEALGGAGQIALPSVVQGHYSMLISWRNRTGLVYGSVDLDVGAGSISHGLTLKKAVTLDGAIAIEDSSGRRVPAPDGVKCALYSLSGLGAQAAISGVRNRYGCFNTQFAAGLYRVEMPKMPPDAYLLSATVAEQDVLTNGFTLDKDSNLNIVIKTPGGVIKGKVQDARKAAVRSATVALVPNEAKRAIYSHYRSTISDWNGNFELRGIAPGSYQVYGFLEIEGAAYRNSEFLRDFDKKFPSAAKPIRIDGAVSLAVDLIAY